MNVHQGMEQDVGCCAMLCAVNKPTQHALYTVMLHKKHHKHQPTAVDSTMLHTMPFCYHVNACWYKKRVSLLKPGQSPAVLCVFSTHRVHTLWLHSAQIVLPSTQNLPSKGHTSSWKLQAALQHEAAPVCST